MVSLKMIEFFGVTDPIEYFSETPQSMQEIIDLKKIGFSFAVESIEKELGEVVVNQYRWSGLTGEKVVTPILMEPCDSLQPLGIPLKNKFTEARSGKRSESYLCPTPVNTMET